jgi:hypothetical protein
MMPGDTLRTFGWNIFSNRLIVRAYISANFSGFVTCSAKRSMGIELLASMMLASAGYPTTHIYGSLESIWSIRPGTYRVKGQNGSIVLQINFTKNVSRCGLVVLINTKSS